jgi:hypothetical protein
MDSLGLPGPIQAPVAVFRAVQLERLGAVDGPDGCDGLLRDLRTYAASQSDLGQRALSKSDTSLAAARAELAAGGVRSAAELAPLVEAAKTEVKRRLDAMVELANDENTPTEYAEWHLLNVWRGNANPGVFGCSNMEDNTTCGCDKCVAAMEGDDDYY